MEFIVLKRLTTETQRKLMLTNSCPFLVVAVSLSFKKSAVRQG